MSDETGASQGKPLVLSIYRQGDANEQLLLEASEISPVLTGENSSTREMESPSAVATHYAE